MGAGAFVRICRGENVQAAFRKAVADAQYDHGHGGYTTIAEKCEVVLIDSAPQPRKVAWRRAQSMLESEDPRINKSGPVGALKLTDGSYLFFGWWASS